MRYTRLEPRFVRHIPEILEPGVIYVSMEYATAAHSCCCGCGDQVVTPFTPTDWSIWFDGENVSLSPSVGNWFQSCKSHYVVVRGRVIGRGSWTQGRIEAERQRDRAAKSTFYANSIEGNGSEPAESGTRDGSGTGQVPQRSKEYESHPLNLTTTSGQRFRVVAIPMNPSAFEVWIGSDQYGGFTKLTGSDRHEKIWCSVATAFATLDLMHEIAQLYYETIGMLPA